jgi:signal transduction histidine kinase/DNA-binding NarL/FixJ family response regulator
MSSRTFLDGGGDTGALMRAMDWSCTPLGPEDAWPQSLRTTVSTCLNSRFPILIWWGPQFVKLYNDAYREVIAAKHPAALGRPGREVWPEIWHIIGPMLESVVHDGAATWSEDQFLPLERHGYPEECYFTFSYSPIRDESGGIGGVFTAVTETTARVVGERRLHLLQALAVESDGDTAATVCRHAAAVLARDTADVPFARIYLLDETGTALRLAAGTGSSPAAPGAPAVIDLREGASTAWPVREALATGRLLVSDDTTDGAPHAFVAPVSGAHADPFGVLVAGVSPMLPIDERYRGFAALVAREIGGALTRARALEGERRRAEALAEIDRAKTAFFANVSHEFRTPLTLMVSPIEDALAAAEPVLAGPELATVHRNAVRLLKLVNALLDFARIEAGRARATFEPTDLAQLTADLASTFRSAVARAGLQFDVECRPLAAPISVDRDAWEKIVLNLLSNALKFTFAGGITVSLREVGGSIELSVRDTGVGIPAAERPHVFERFHRVHGAPARTHEGSGIGLALVHELVKMHGGTMRVESETGSGTTFTVAIPARRADEGSAAGARVARDAAAVAARPYVLEALRWLPEAAAARAGARDRVPAAARILIADDNADMREYVSRLLADRWIVESVGDGEAALEAARARPPALVISDVMMPRLDGFGLLRALRADEATSGVPVILLSARAGEEARIEGLEAGADDYIVKPFSARELRARVEAQLLRAEIRAIQAAHDRRLADMFRHAPVGIAMLRGPRHVFEFANDQYLSMVGRRDLVGRPLVEAFPEIAAQGIPALLDRVYASGEPHTEESRTVTLDPGPHGSPEQVSFNFVYQPLRDRDGRVEGIAVVAVDVTELVRARQDAETANRAKDQFLAVLGHELRNPIAPILTATRLLELKGPADPSLGRLRETIVRQALHLSTLVEDLLDVGRIMTGKLRLEKAQVDVHTIVKQAIEACMPAIERRRHTLDVTLPEQPIVVEADAGRLVQVICNLLNNAAKFTPEGRRIDLSAGVQAGTVVLRVRDEGIGIAPQMLERVFDRFVQGAAAASDAQAGLGIGLSIVKTIVEMHGGTIAAYSDGIGAGAEFVVSLPVAAATASGAA